MPQRRHEGGKGAKLRGTVNAVSLSQVMNARQLYIPDPPFHRHGDVYCQQDFIRLDEESEQDPLTSITKAFFKWQQKLNQYS